jgi:hypothetical protein
MPERSLQQLLITNFALNPSGYTGSRGDTGYVGSAGGGGGSSGVKITGLTYPNSATAANPAGGETITVAGSGFNTGANVYLETLSCATTYVSSTSLAFTTPAKSVASYVLYVYNIDGSAGMYPAGLTYSNMPVWVTASGALNNAATTASYSQTVSATGDGTITYSVTSGSLPTGLSLNTNTGAITGTATNAGSTSTFTITAADSQNQQTSRSFSILVTTVPNTVEYLVVAGGGGGAGRYQTGGGGGGGLLTATGYSVVSGSPITVTVGAGGAGGPQGGDGSTGQNSVFGTITAYGGGYGGNATTGGNGGSGGGTAPYSSPTAGKGVYPGSTYISAARQGFDGSTGYNSSGIARGGAGGGAGGAGASGDVYLNQGGIGVLSSISGTSTGYAGGGGGGSYGIPPGNAYTGYGGGGGGGLSPNRINAESGTPYTGGGGGGTERDGTGVGGSGGSGIVIVRYPDSYNAAASTTGSPTVTVTGGYRIYKWTTSGSITF